MNISGDRVAAMRLPTGIYHRMRVISWEEIDPTGDSPWTLEWGEPVAGYVVVDGVAGVGCSDKSDRRDEATKFLLKQKTNMKESIQCSCLMK